MECSPLQEVTTHRCRLCLVLEFEGSLETVMDHTFTHEELDNLDEEERLECCRPIDEVYVYETYRVFFSSLVPP